MSDRARRITLEEQRQLADGRNDHRPQLPSNYVPAPPERRSLPVQTPANDALGMLVAGLMASAHTTHTATPVERGKAMLLKATAVTIALAVFTLMALAMLDALTFFLWILLASAEWVLCFLVLAVLDWREHPSAVRWQWTNGLLGMMEREQEARLKAQYGEDWDK